MATFISHSPAETEAFAASIARDAQTGLVIGLTGDLGAGKTQFVKGFARGLGVTEPVLSPTFALLRQYTTGRQPLYHMDLYRLEDQGQIAAAGLEEYLAPAGITIVEWWNHWKGARPPALWEFQFETESETARRITYANSGP